MSSRRTTAPEPPSDADARDPACRTSAASPRSSVSTCWSRSATPSRRTRRSSRSRATRRRWTCRRPRPASSSRSWSSRATRSPPARRSWSSPARPSSRRTNVPAHAREPAPGRAVRRRAVRLDRADQAAQRRGPRRGSAAPQRPRTAAEAGPRRSAAAEPRHTTSTSSCIGAGPGGYTAAFRAADLGLKVALVERWPTLGGVCLNVGCIPSKALLHAAKVIDDAQAMAAHGIDFGPPQIDAARLRELEEPGRRSTHRRPDGAREATQGRRAARRRHVRRAITPSRWHRRRRRRRTVTFAHCIIAAGSESLRLPGLPDDPRIIDSTGALELDLPRRLLVIGGGIIGLEMATVYAALGVKVSVVELTRGSDAGL